MNRPVVIYPRPRIRPEAVMAVVCLGLAGLIGLALTLSALGSR